MLATFLVKDVWQDYAKDVDVSAREALRDYVTDGRLVQIMHDIKSMSVDVDRIRAYADSADKTPKSDRFGQYLQVDRDANMFQEHIAEMAMLNRRLSRGWDSLCSPDDIRGLRTRMNEIINTNEKDTPAASKLLEGIKDDIHRCHERVLLAVVNQDLEGKDLVGVQSFVEYSLFGVGWALTLLGKLSKKEEIEGIS